MYDTKPTFSPTGQVTEAESARTRAQLKEIAELELAPIGNVRSYVSAILDLTEASEMTHYDRFRRIAQYEASQKPLELGNEIQSQVHGEPQPDHHGSPRRYPLHLLSGTDRV